MHLYYIAYAQQTPYSQQVLNTHTQTHILAIWNAADLSCDFKDKLTSLSSHHVKKLISSPSSSHPSPSFQYSTPIMIEHLWSYQRPELWNQSDLQLSQEKKKKKKKANKNQAEEIFPNDH